MRATSLRGTRARAEAFQLLAIALVAVVLAGCAKHENAAGRTEPIEVSAITIKPADTPVSFEYAAQTQSSHQVQIVARVNGFISRKVYTEGSAVKAGQVMYQQDRRPFQAQLDAAKAALAEQQARFQVANANLGRVRPLAARNALSQRDLDEAVGQQQAAAAAIDGAKANVEAARLNLGYTTIMTPISGLSSFSRVQDGQYVTATDGQLTYVAQIDPIWINFNLSENDVLSLRTQEASGQLRRPGKGEFEVEVVLADNTVYPHKGRITFSNADYNPQTGTFLLRATLPNPEGVLRPGQFVRARILGARRPNAILVPQAAVLQGAAGHFVVLVDKNHKAQMRPVQVGTWLGNDWFINSGLEAGDTVVVDGMVRLSPGAAVKIVSSSSDRKE